jgi:hypothetical protein
MWMVFRTLRILKNSSNLKFLSFIFFNDDYWTKWLKSIVLELIILKMDDLIKKENLIEMKNLIKMENLIKRKIKNSFCNSSFSCCNSSFSWCDWFKWFCNSSFWPFICRFWHWNSSFCFCNSSFSFLKKRKRENWEIKKTLKSKKGFLDLLNRKFDYSFES